MFSNRAFLNCVFSILTLLSVGCFGSSSGTSGDKAMTVTSEDLQAKYRAALVSVIAGSYAGECLQYPDGTPVTGSIGVSAAGDVAAPGAAGSLMGSGVSFTFNRKFSSGQVESIGFTTADLSSDAGLNLGLGVGQSSDSGRASARMGIGAAPGMSCTQSVATVALKTKSLSAPLAKFLTRKQFVRCISGGSVSTLNLELSADKAKIGDEIYSLTSDLDEESAGILTPSGTLSYQVKTSNERTFGILLDNKGGLAALAFTGKSGISTSCVPQ